MNADSGQRELFLSFLKSRYAFWTLLIGVLACVAYGAWKSSLLVAVVGPMAVLLGVVGVSLLIADRLAAHRFFARYAHSVGLSYASRRSSPLSRRC